MGADVEPLSISLMDLIMKRIKVIGSQQNGPEYLYEALDFVAQGKVKTIIETYPLAEAPKAYLRVVEGKARFRAVLTMQSRRRRPGVFGVRYARVGMPARTICSLFFRPGFRWNQPVGAI